jgi:hypothetical protein
MKTRVDFYTKAILTAIALLLAALVMKPVPVAADSETSNLYIEPGTSPIRNVNGGVPSDGKVVINLSTGDVYGFPTHGAGAPYPVDPFLSDGKPTVVRPIFLGKFDFSQMKKH